MTDPLSDQQRRAIRAAEFALGLLDESEQDEALRLLAQDAEFAAHVRRWEIQIDSWYAEQEVDAVPSAQLWPRIAAGIGKSSASPVTTTPTKQVAPGWRIMALAASLAAVLFAGLWLSARSGNEAAPAVRTVAAPLTQLSVAQVQSASDQRLLAVVYDRATGRLLARLSSLDTKGAVPELWLIGSDGKPRSLGTSRSGGEVSVVLPAETRRLFADGATIAISLEPSSNAKHEAPQGTILGSAKISAI